MKASTTPQVWVVDEAGSPLLEKYYEAESTLALVCRARYVDTPAVLTVKTEQVSGGADSVLRLARKA
ncbi:unnamed protein product [Leptidea sinapis]|uniref:Uncharacterized protein n=1 Tax=Leptidea sinapis TaxID=189913 RepID=A0A5E4QHA9_9NEOP|nr:unnamed protein product [Leptidea sinapis]